MSKTKTCPICSQKEPLVTSFQPSIDQPLLAAIQSGQQAWTPEEGICLKCLDHFHQKLLNQLLNPNGTEGYTVLPTPIRLNAHPDYSGKGVTICFIDSGFFLHPDLTCPKNRIKKILDITQPDRPISYFKKPHNNAWHGTMTSVVCAGNGHLSNGVYKGIASNANLVLLKVMDDEQKITESNIIKALKWVNQNHKKYKINIVNLSVTGDEEESYRKSEINQIIQQLFAAGINVVAAVGNDLSAPILPPANALEVITVGGLDDQNTLDSLQFGLYHSTYGYTIDGLTKPELIAPAAWISAPILPKTEAANRAQNLFATLAETQDKTALLAEIKKRKWISAHYQYADGTSFAAPIVCSIIAQIIEASPTLSPLMIREILLTTARTIPATEKIRQGFGVIQAGHAVAKASKETNHDWIKTNPIIDYAKQKITFRFHHHNAKEVYLSGNFTGWNPKKIPLKKEKNGAWKIEIPLLSTGKYLYKYVINEHQWLTDPLNFYRQPDGYNGLNSQFFV